MLALSITVAALFAQTVSAASKRGVAWADSAHPTDVNLFTGSVISWNYNWAPKKDSYQTIPGYVPMQWNGNNIATLATSVSQAGATAVLGFNEPDFASQANMSPTDAANLWKQYIQPLKAKGIRLIAPAITSAPSGKPWLRSFIAACGGCTFDALAIHWYGEGVGNFYDYIWSIKGEFGSNVWITEYASTYADHASNLDFLKQSIAYLDTLDWVEKYAWFGVFRDDASPYALINSAGALNDMGNAYLGK